MLVAEDYPELLATENFTQLQTELSAVEEKISITRRVYNDTVETYNTKIQVFPPVIVASLFGFERREFFDAPVEAETAPQVSVGGGDVKIAGRIIWRLVFLAIFGGILYAIGLVNWSEVEQSFRVDRADVRVEVQDDGSLHVTEQLTFDFTGNFSGAFRDIPLAEPASRRGT